MPTGFTASVADGTISDLRSFAMRCARGMGALMSMRDLPFDAPIPEKFEPSQYHAKALADAIAERQRIYNLTNAQADVEAKAAYEEEVAAIAARRADKALQRKRYSDMIEQVQKWAGAPEGLKEFMLSQLGESLDFDCPPHMPDHTPDPVRQGGDGWRVRKLECLARDIAYHADQDAKELARTNECNAWLSQLRKSLEVSDGIR